MFLKVFLGLTLFFVSAQNAALAEDVVPKTPQRIKTVLVVNRPTTLEDQNLNGPRTVTAAQWATLMQYKYHSVEQKAAQDRLERFQTALKKLNESKKLKLDTTPFSVEYTKDEKENVYGDVVVVTPSGYHVLEGVETVPLVDPEAPLDPKRFKAEQIAPKPRELPPVTVESLSELAKGSTEDIILPLLTWTISAPNDQLKCKSVERKFVFEDADLQRVFVKAFPSEKDFVTPATTKRLSEVATKMKRADRFELFQKRENPCLNPVYKELWKVLPTVQKENLAWDFKHYLERIYSKKKSLTFDGRIEGHVIAKEAQAELEPMLAYVEAVLIQFAQGELTNYLPRGFREWATWNTNTPDPSSRVEPNDVLTYYVAHHLLRGMVDETAVGTVGRNEIARTAIQHRIVPERYSPKIYVQKSSDEKTKRDASATYFLFCAGDSIAEYGDPKTGKLKGDRLLTYFTFSEKEMRDFRPTNRIFHFGCGQTTAQMTSPVEKLHIPLFDPIDHKYTLSKDKKIKAVMTFELSQVAPKELVDALKAGIALGYPGYKAKDDVVVKDLKKEFLAEMLDADFYFPANHQMNGAQFALSNDRGIKVTFVREKDGVTTEIAVFLPPSMIKEGEGIKQTVVTDAELAELFKKRRALKETKRLTVLNLACGSAQCVPHWMSAYKKSLDENMSEADAKTASKDVVVAIGATRSFESGSAAAYLKHARYPFAALDMAAKEKTVKDLLDFLIEDKAAANANEKYQPKSNAGQKDFFDIKAQEDRINIVIVLSTGEKIIH